MECQDSTAVFSGIYKSKRQGQHNACVVKYPKTIVDINMHYACIIGEAF